MRTCLFIVFFTIVVQKLFAVQPGDPFPTNRYQSKYKWNGIELNDPHDDEPVPSNSFDPRYQRKVFIENKTIPLKTTRASLSSITLTTTTRPTLSPEIPISQNNLIRINRWKFEDTRSNEIRFWYEPEGGHMGKGWSFDRVAFLAYSKQEPGTKPVFAFHSETADEWTNTLQLDSTPPMIAAEQWISDGISFFTYPTKRNFAELQPVWRYWNAWKNSTHRSHRKPTTFLVVSRNDQEQAREGWIRDQILFYALPFEV